MNGKELEQLIERSNFSKLEFAQSILNINYKTLINRVKNQEEILPYFELVKIREAFADSVIAPLIRTFNQAVFQKIPSEFICLWIVKTKYKSPTTYARNPFEIEFKTNNPLNLCVLANTARFQCLSNDRKNCWWRYYDDSLNKFVPYCYQKTNDFCYRNDKLERGLEDKCLTCKVAREGKTYRLNLQEIEKSNDRKCETVIVPYYSSKKCFNLMHTPFLKGSMKGPKTIAILKNENLLNHNNNSYTVEEKKAFSSEHEETAKILLENFFNQPLASFIENEGLGKLIKIKGIPDFIKEKNFLDILKCFGFIEEEYFKF